MTRTIWHELFPFRWRNLLPWRRCLWCGRLMWGWPTWCWIRWGIPEHCSQQCADDEIDAIALDYYAVRASRGGE